MVKCLLNDCEFELVSIIPLQAIQQYPGSIDIRQLSELLDTSLNLAAVNGTKIPHLGWMEFRLKLTPSSTDSNQEEMVVPFLMTSENLDCHILGYTAFARISAAPE